MRAAGGGLYAALAAGVGETGGLGALAEGVPPAAPSAHAALLLSNEDNPPGLWGRGRARGYLVGIGVANALACIHFFPRAPRGVVLLDVDPAVVLAGRALAALLARRAGADALRRALSGPGLERLLVRARRAERDPGVAARLAGVDAAALAARLRARAARVWEAEPGAGADVRRALEARGDELGALAARGRLAVVLADAADPRTARAVAALPGFERGRNVVYLSNAVEVVAAAGGDPHALARAADVLEAAAPRRNLYVDTLWNERYQLRARRRVPRVATLPRPEADGASRGTLRRVGAMDGVDGARWTAEAPLAGRIARLAAAGRLQAAEAARRGEIRAAREAWRPRLDALRDEPVHAELRDALEALGPGTPLRPVGNRGGVYLLDGGRGRPLLLRPVDERPFALNSPRSASPLPGRRADERLVPGIPPAGGPGRELLAAWLAEALGVAHLVPRTTAAVVERPEWGEGGKLCVCEEYLPGTRALGAHRADEAACAADVEALAVLAWAAGMVNPHHHRYRQHVRWARPPERVRPGPGGRLVRFDHGWSFTADGAAPSTAWLQAVPRAADALFSARAAELVARVPVAATAARMRAWGLGEAEAPFRDRVAFLRAVSGALPLALGGVARRARLLGHAAWRGRGAWLAALDEPALRQAEAELPRVPGGAVYL